MLYHLVMFHFFPISTSTLDIQYLKEEDFSKCIFLPTKWKENFAECFLQRKKVQKVIFLKGVLQSTFIVSWMWPLISVKSQAHWS